MTRRCRHIAPLTLAALLLASLIAGCQRKPLYLAQHGNVSIATAEYDLRLEMLWGIDWQSQWQYPWDEAKYGPLGYTEPTGIHVISYLLDDAMQRCRWYNDRHISSKGGRIQLSTDNHYDMLLYSDDTEWIHFPDREEHRSNNSDFATFNVTTRTNSRARYTRSQEGYNEPDQLFGTFIEDLYISDDPDDYIMERNEDGSVSYVCKMEAELQPYTYIYLYQVILRNNRLSKDSVIVTSYDGITANGLASGVDLFTGHTHSTPVSLTQASVAPIVKEHPLTLPNGTDTVADIIGARIQTWGLPDIIPMKVATRGEDFSVKDSTYLGIGLKLYNGYTYVMQKNVTEQMEQHPTGGVITLFIDVAKEVPDSIIHRPTVEGDGFKATVNQWENEVKTEIEI